MPERRFRWAPGTGEELHRPLSVLTGVRLLLVSFLGLIALGALGLLILPGLYSGERLGLVDALFTATSAVCVTGLVVVDTAESFTTLGQVWIALLIQLGGLGILTFATLVISLARRRVTLLVEDAAGPPRVAGERLDLKELVRSVALTTLVVEAVGAALLWLLWRERLGAGAAVWHAVFQAISAFCNAGFSTFSDSLMGFQSDLGTIAVMGALIVIGGLGFVVIVELRTRFLRRATRRMSLHSGLVLGVTAVLLLAGTLLYLTFEAQNALAGQSWPVRIANAAFMSVTARTAGFSTVDYGTVSDPSLFLTLVLMFIGGSPGSTAGGIKTTTVALVFLLLVSRLRGARHVPAHGRTIPDETVNRATGVTIGALAVLAIGFFALLMTEIPADVTDRVHMTRLVFETGSAFGTVGLSMGATAGLSISGKIIVMILMFVGRLGPLTFAAAMVFVGRRRRAHYRYALEDVAIG